MLPCQRVNTLVNQPLVKTRQAIERNHHHCEYVMPAKYFVTILCHSARIVDWMLKAEHSSNFLAYLVPDLEPTPGVQDSKNYKQGPWSCTLLSPWHIMKALCKVV